VLKNVNYASKFRQMSVFGPKVCIFKQNFLTKRKYFWESKKFGEGQLSFSPYCFLPGHDRR